MTPKEIRSKRAVIARALGQETSRWNAESEAHTEIVMNLNIELSELREQCEHPRRKRYGKNSWWNCMDCHDLVVSPENSGDDRERPAKHAKHAKERHHRDTGGTEKKDELRFVKDAVTGVIRDNQTVLEWLVGPDRDTDYAMAEKWVASLSGVSGGGWRMPTVAELKTLYQWGVGDRIMDPVFGTTGWWVWGEPRDESSAWGFTFHYGGLELWGYRDYSCNLLRVFAARSRR